jgi:hypothetical protein
MFPDFSSFVEETEKVKNGGLWRGVSSRFRIKTPLMSTSGREPICMKTRGKPMAGNLHDGFDEAGIEDVLWWT